MAEPSFKAGFAALLGRPNAGKSTLLNALLGRKFSIISPKPQTTRHEIVGIKNGPNYQIAFLDTPGLLSAPKDQLQKSLSRSARKAAREDADVLILVADPSLPSAEELEELANLRHDQTPLILALNKMDLNPAPEKIQAALEAYQAALHPEATLKISALKGPGVRELQDEIAARLPESPPFYDRDQLSDRWERFFAAEFVREQIFALYEQEIPHASAVVIEAFRERPRGKDLIEAAVFVEKESQKGILIGRKGQALRNLRGRAQSAIENFLGRPVDLEIWIKVRKNWRKDPRALKDFGYL